MAETGVNSEPDRSMPLGATAILSSLIALFGPAPKTRLSDDLPYKKIVPKEAGFVDPVPIFAGSLFR